jgi:hypothetical protein
MYKVNVTQLRVRVMNKFIVKIIVNETTPEGYYVTTADLSLWDAIGNRQLSWKLIHLCDLESEVRDMLPDDMFDIAWDVIKVAIDTNPTDLIN